MGTSCRHVTLKATAEGTSEIAEIYVKYAAHGQKDQKLKTKIIFMLLSFAFLQFLFAFIGFHYVFICAPLFSSRFQLLYYLL